MSGDIEKVMALADALDIGDRVRAGHAKRVAAGSVFRAASNGVAIAEAYNWMRLDYRDVSDLYRTSLYRTRDEEAA